MEVTYGNTNFWNWVAERWAYFTVMGIVYLIVYYATGSIIQAVSAIVILCVCG